MTKKKGNFNSVALRAQLEGLTKKQFLARRRRERIHQLVNSPLFNAPIALLIFLSIVLIFLEFFVSPSDRLDRIIYWSDIITWIFVGELSLRFYAAPIKRVFFGNYWIDILSVLPVLRIFRAFRILRLLRLFHMTRVIVIILKDWGWLSNRVEQNFGNFAGLFAASLLIVLCATLASLSVGSDDFAPSITIHAFIERAWETTFLFTSGELIGEIPANNAGKIVYLLITIAGLVVFAVLVGVVSASMATYLRTKMDAKDLSLGDLKNHLIICGWDSMGGTILHELELVTDVWRRGVVVIAETDRNIIAEGEIKNSRRLFHIKDDFTKPTVLEKAGAAVAKTAIVLADSSHSMLDQDRDARTVLASLTLEKINPKIFTCAELLNERNAVHLEIAGVEEIISRSAITAGLFAATAANSGVTPVVRDVLTHREGSYFKKIPVPEDFVDKEFIEAFHYLKKMYDITVLAVENKNDKGHLVQHINPAATHLLSTDDQLIIILKRDSEMCEL